MRYIMTTLVLLLLNSCMNLSEFSVSEAGVSLPCVKALDLRDNQRSFPEDFTAERTLVMVGFYHKQQREIDIWRDHLEKEIRTDNQQDYFELPTLDIGVSSLRSFIFSAMKRGTKDSWLAERRIPVFVDKTAFMAALAIHDDMQIHLFVCDRKGKILAQFSGVYDDEKYMNLMAVMRGI